MNLGTNRWINTEIDNIENILGGDSNGHREKKNSRGYERCTKDMVMERKKSPVIRY